jgi:hypothetical protein
MRAQEAPLLDETEVPHPDTTRLRTLAALTGNWPLDLRTEHDQQIRETYPSGPTTLEAVRWVLDLVAGSSTRADSQQVPHGEPWYGHHFKEVRRGYWQCSCGKVISEAASTASKSCYPPLPRRHTYDDDGVELFTADQMRAYVDTARAPADSVLEDAELGRIAMCFVDRAGDPHPGIDDAETICREFYAAMSAVLDPRFQRRMDAARKQGGA